MPDLPLIRTLAHCFRTVLRVMADLVRLAFLAARSRSALAAEDLFLRKQLALFQERQVKPRRANDATRWTMATRSRLFPWRDALVNVKANTLIRWHRGSGERPPAQGGSRVPRYEDVCAWRPAS